MFEVGSRFGEIALEETGSAEKAAGEANLRCVAARLGLAMNDLGDLSC